MSSVQLLDKTRKIGKLLHNNNSSKVVFSDICKVMREILNSNVLVISRKGKVLGVGKSSLPSRSPVRGWEHSLFISVTNSMTSMILFSASMELQWWDWKCSGQ